jgi:hypothetical protein
LVPCGVPLLQPIAFFGLFRIRPLGHYGKILAGRDAVTDGPFVQSKEAIAGFFVIRADSLEQAVELARECPGLEFGQSVEVRAMVSEPYELHCERCHEYGEVDGF